MGCRPIGAVPDPKDRALRKPVISVRNSKDPYLERNTGQPPKGTDIHSVYPHPLGRSRWGTTVHLWRKQGPTGHVQPVYSLTDLEKPVERYDTVVINRPPTDS